LARKIDALISSNGAVN